MTFRTTKTCLSVLVPLAVSLVALTAGCGSKQSDTVVIGEYGALTGSQSSFGQSTDNGVRMAIAEANASSTHGVNGKLLEIKCYDDASDSQQAKTVVTKLVLQDNVTAVIGEVASSSSLQAGPVCQTNKVPMVTPASTNAKVTRIGDYVFRTCYIDPFQGGVMATFAIKNLHAKTAAILKDSSQDYSIGLADAFETAFTKLGGTVVDEESYGKDATDFHAQLQSIKSKNPDIIFIPGYYNEVGVIGREARQDLAMKQPLLGGDGWDGPLFKLAGNNLDGCYYSTHYSKDSKNPEVQKFVADYTKSYPGATPDAMAALGYDATNIVISAMRAAGPPADGDYTSETYRAKLRDAIAATKDFNGVTGKITFGPDRNAIKPAVVLGIHNQTTTLAATIQPSDVPL